MVQASHDLQCGSRCNQCLPVLFGAWPVTALQMGSIHTKWTSTLCATNHLTLSGMGCISL